MDAALPSCKERPVRSLAFFLRLLGSGAIL